MENVWVENVGWRMSGGDWAGGIRDTADFSGVPIIETGAKKMRMG